MSKPYIHAESSAKRWGGTPEEYLPIHQLMDSSKGTVADNRHRALTHNSWFIAPDGPLERIFGVVMTNSVGRKVMVRDIGEQHILEDFGGKFIPTPQDYLEQVPIQDWMNNGRGTPPPSFEKLDEQEKEKLRGMLANLRMKNEVELEIIEQIDEFPEAVIDGKAEEFAIDPSQLNSRAFPTENTTLEMKDIPANFTDGAFGARRNPNLID